MTELYIEDEEIKNFLAAHPASACTSEEKIHEFLSNVHQSKVTGVDLKHIMGFLYAEGKTTAKPNNRVADMMFSNRLIKVGEKNSFVTLLWRIVETNCSAIDAINIELRKIIEKQSGKKGYKVAALSRKRTAADKTRANRGLATFISKRPQCFTNRDKIEQFLELIDNNPDITGKKLKEMIVELNLEGKLLTKMKGTYRVDNLSLREKTKGRTAITKTEFKHSLVWLILSTYCDKMDVIIDKITATLKK